MKAKELIQELMKYDQELEIKFKVPYEQELYPINKVIIKHKNLYEHEILLK